MRRKPRKLGRPALKRREDPRLITGNGNFLDDVKLAGMTYAAILRSPVRPRQDPEHRHQPREIMPGVIGVFTGERLHRRQSAAGAWQAAGVENNVATPRAPASARSSQVGDPVAVVVAERVYQADDALEAIEVEFEELPAVVDAGGGSTPGAAAPRERAEQHRHPMDVRRRDRHEVDAALADAEVAGRQRLINQRLIPTAMEPRGSIGNYDPGTERVHPVGHLPGASRPPAAPRGVRARHSRAEDPGHRPGRRWRVRLARSSSTSTWR